MNVLLLYPEFPDTFWSFKHALKFVGKKAAFPPLGLLTIANMLPANWNCKLVDLNVSHLQNKDLAWADFAFISGMTIQKESAKKLITRCKQAGLKIAAGGPLFTMEHEDFPEVDHFVLNEAETTLPPFLNDLAQEQARHIYADLSFPTMASSPVPRWDLIRLKDYHAIGIQYSRGCPFNCDFCNITSLFGHRVRTKTPDQIIAELDSLYQYGWRGRVFFVDDNFIGNKNLLKEDLLPLLIKWRKDKKGICFQTEASINLADDDTLMKMMTDAGFDTVFVGIETPEEMSLAECNKKQNKNRDLISDVKKIQRAGIQVQAGFIVGFDHDTPSIFKRQIDFIQKSGIVTAMVGLLQAPIGTKLYERLKSEGRILGASSGDNVEGTTNIKPVMDFQRLHAGYREIMDSIYSPKYYYKRVKTLLREYGNPKYITLPTWADLKALMRSFFRLGFIGKERKLYWNLLLWTCIKRPALLHLAVTLAITGHHLRKVSELHLKPASQEINITTMPG